MIYIIARFFLFIWCKLFFGYKAYGRDNVPKKGGVIIASNHASYFDPIYAGVGAYRPLYFMARDSLFKNLFFGALIRSVHSFPVKRNFYDLGAMRKAARLLKTGKALLIFPEATRTQDGNLQPAKPGISFLAHDANVPVVPFYIKGNYDVLPKGARRVKLAPVSARFGKPLDFSEFMRERGYSAASGAYRPFADYIMRRIAELRADA